MSKIKDKNRIFNKRKANSFTQEKHPKGYQMIFSAETAQKKNYIHTKNKDKGTWKKAIKQQGDAAKEERNRGRLQNQPEKINKITGSTYL